MMRTLTGPERFRQGTDHYFASHDGEAATCEDFVQAIEQGAGLDLVQFRLWYSQAGTPKIAVGQEQRGDTAVLRLSQAVPPTPGQQAKQPMVVPLKLALFDRESGKRREEELVVLDESQVELSFPGFAAPPVLSINRGFSAPVAIERELAREDLVFLAAHDDDPFARYEAMQELVVGHLTQVLGGFLSDGQREAGYEAIGEALAAALDDPALDDLMRGELMILPGQSYLSEQFLVSDPGAIHAEREGLKVWLGKRLESRLTALHERASAVPYSLDAAARGARKVKTQALVYLATADPALAAELAAAQYRAADNMTDRQGALAVLAGLDTPARAELLADFHARYAGNALVIDKWFGLQAGSLHPEVLAQVRALSGHADFTIRNPNRVRSLYMPFTGTARGFHAPGGEGYRVLAEMILQLDPLNPQTAARFIPPLGRWRRIEPGRSALMRAELERIVSAPGLSRDTYEQASKSLT
jgi:aminopeptidase N